MVRHRWYRQGGFAASTPVGALSSAPGCTRCRDTGGCCWPPFHGHRCGRPQPGFGFSGSLIVAEFADLAAAQGWADADLRAAGVYASVSVKLLSARCCRECVGAGAERVAAFARGLRALPFLAGRLGRQRRHVGHGGARDGRGHFRVRVVSAALAGQLPLARPPLVWRRWAR